MSPTKWKCALCGHSAIIKQWPVHCVCGAMAHEGGEDNISVPQGALQERFAVCKQCKHWGNRRCVKIDLGCRLTFMNYIGHPDKECPIGKWGKHQCNEH